MAVFVTATGSAYVTFFSFIYKSLSCKHAPIHKIIIMFTLAILLGNVMGNRDYVLIDSHESSTHTHRHRHSPTGLRD